MLMDQTSFNVEPLNEDVKEYLGFVKICWKLMAMIPISSRSIAGKIFNHFYRIFVNFHSVYIFIFSAIDLISAWDGDLFDVIFNLVNTLIYVSNTAYLIYFQYYNDDLITIIDCLNKTFKFRSAEGLTRLDMRPSFEKARKYSIIFTVACYVGALHWAIMPFINPNKRTLPVKIWYPFDVQQSPYYEVAYVSQLFGQVMVASVYSNYGIFYLSECVLICGQFDVLCCSLRNLRYTALLKRKYPVNKLVELSGYNYRGANRCTLPEDERNAYFSGSSVIIDPKLRYCLENNSKKKQTCRFQIQKMEEDTLPIFNKQKIMDDELHNEIVESIKECVIHHQQILKYCSQFEAFFSPIAFVKILQITLLACFIMYSFSESFKITLLEYMILTCSDLLILCYFGNEVMLRSINVGIAACGGPWQLYGKRSLKELLPLLIRSTIPVCFTGGKFYRLTLENYLAVLKVSFSYFTVLRNVNEKDS